MAAVDDFVRWWGQASYQDRMGWMNQVYGGNIPQVELDRMLDDEIKRQYGYLASFLSDPEIGPLLRRAAAEGWTQERLQADLYRTQWWQTKSAAQREWQLLVQSDPATVTAKIEAAAVEIQNFASQLGLGDKFTADVSKWMAGVWLSLGLSQAQIQEAIAAQAEYQPGAPPIGSLGLSMTQVKARAADFGLQMSDEAAFQWAKQVASGDSSIDAVDVYLREQAKSRYSWLAEDLDRGATIKQLFDPMIQQTSQLLEIAPASIDLTDPRYSQLIDHVDDQGVRRSMTTAEAATYIRSTPEWQSTDNATKAASQAAEALLRTFGKVAA